MDLLNKKIVVLTHNPKGEWGDVRPIIELENGYKNWNKSINVEIDELVLIYISKTAFRIEYLMKVVKINETSIDLELVEKFDEDIAKLLSYENLLKHGLKPATVNYILNNNIELYEYVISVLKEEKMKNQSEQTQFLNQILFGPPGTGKTYNTINKAIEIIENRVLSSEELKPENRENLKAKFEEYKKAGQIEFVTFHQSYGYEEFVEGIKAISSDDERNPTDDLIYKVEHGIFKQLCKNAENKEYMIDDLSIDDNSSIWKISLGSTYGNEIKTKCFNDNEIRIGWTDVQEVGDDNFNKLGSNNQSTIKNFIEDMEIGDLVISIYNQNKIDGIGIIESEYKLDDDEHYNKFRKVKWLSKDILDLTQLNGNKVFVQKTVYKINRFKPKDLLSFIKQNEIQVKSDNINKNYILIIDEINRGNISKIFGELITLIEPSKRIGADEEIRIKLPYSGDREESFGVPQNLYIIGTMNTADRSIAPIDTALRRRFVFEEMVPNSSLLSKEKTPDIYDQVNLQSLLEAINTRIEYLYDRDHTIGHAYLIDVKTLPDLIFTFKNKIIPLLAEYFYEDWENIDLVLNNNGFIKIKEDNNKYLAVVNKKISGKKIYEVSNENWGIVNFKKIYDDNVNLSKKIEDDQKDVLDSNE